MAAIDDVDSENVAFFLAEYGEAATVYPPDGDARSVTGIVARSIPETVNEPRGTIYPIRVSLPNDATSGISGAEWNSRFKIGVPRYRGGEAVQMRTIRPIHQSAAWITWEVA